MKAIHTTRRHLHVVQRLAAIIALAVLAPATASAACTVEQRIDLAKAGYAKAEIEKLCATAAVPAAPGTVGGSAGTSREIPLHELLAKGTIAGGNQRDYEKRRCVASEAGISFRDDGFKGYESLEASTKFSIDRDDKEILILVSLNSGFNTESCIVMRVDKWRFGDNPNQFEAEASQYQAEYDAIVAALKKRGIPID